MQIDSLKVYRTTHKLNNIETHDQIHLFTLQPHRSLITMHCTKLLKALLEAI